MGIQYTLVLSIATSLTLFFAIKSRMESSCGVKTPYTRSIFSPFLAKYRDKHYLCAHQALLQFS